jgi:hypothetical protein
MKQRPTFAVSGKRPSGPVSEAGPRSEAESCARRRSRHPRTRGPTAALATHVRQCGSVSTLRRARRGRHLRVGDVVRLRFRTAAAFTRDDRCASAPPPAGRVHRGPASRGGQREPIPLHSTREGDETLAPIDREAIARRHDPTDLDHLLRSCSYQSPVQFRALTYLQRLCATDDLPNAFTALAQVAPHTGPLGQNNAKDQNSYGAVLLIALYTLKPMLIARADVSGIIACVRAGYNHSPSVHTGFDPAAEARLCNIFLEPELADIIRGGLSVRANRTQFFGEAKAWAARARAWKRAREAALPALGDVANLVAQLPLMPAAHHWARLLGFCSTSRRSSKTSSP